MSDNGPSEQTRMERLLAMLTNDPYNNVSGHVLPDGGIELFLSHRSTMDYAVCVRVRGDEDIAFMYGSEEEQAIAERTNEGGPWNEAAADKAEIQPGSGS